MRDNRLKRRAIEQCGRKHVQRVEPAAGLADVLDDEVTRTVSVEPLLVFERIVRLRERHRTRFEPAVENLWHATHCRLAGWVVWVWSS